MSNVRMPAGPANTATATAAQAASAPAKSQAAVPEKGKLASMAAALSPSLSGAAVGGMVSLLNSKLGQSNNKAPDTVAPQNKLDKTK